MGLLRLSCIIAVGVVVLAAANPRPLGGTVATVQGVVSPLGGLIGGLVGAAAKIIKGTLGDGLGSIVNFVLNTGVAGLVSTTLADGGCLADDIATVVKQTLEGLKLIIKTCVADADCLNIGIKTCGIIPEVGDIGKICLYS